MPLIITDGMGEGGALPPLNVPPPGQGAAPQPVAVDFGQDFDFLADLNPRFALVGGYYNLGQALAHRLETPRGGLFYDADYGTDIRAYLAAPVTAQTVTNLVGDVQSECLKDDRVQTVATTITFNQAAKTLSLTVNGTTADGPFTYVMDVSQVTVALLSRTELS